MIINDLSMSEKLIILRSRAGLSQLALAKKANISRNAISLMEVGKYNPTVDFLRSVCQALECELIIDIKPYSEFHDGEQK